MAKFITITKKIPIKGSSQHAAFTIDDLLFDWVEIEVPSGGARLMAVTGYVKSKLDADQTVTQWDFSLLFANKAVADSIGGENAIAGHEKFPDNITGTMEVTGADYVGAATNGRMYSLFTADAHTKSLAFNSDPTVKASSVGYDKYFVAGIANAAIDFTSTFTINDTNIATVSPGDQLVVTAVSDLDAREHFRAGDELIADDGAVIGTVASVDNATTITLTEAIATGVLVDDDSVYIKHPLVLTFHFEQ